MITKAPEVHAFQSGKAGLFANASLVEMANQHLRASVTWETPSSRMPCRYATCCAEADGQHDFPVHRLP